MFVSAAHSFKQQARLAVTLAWVAGYTNIVALLSCGTVTSHMTGAASNLGRGVVRGDWTLVGFELYLLGTFLAGAVLAGIATETGKRRGWDSIYVLPMVFEALLLAGFALGLELLPQDWAGTATTHQPPSAVYVLIGLAAGAMGLQNATITSISSGVVRTTHVTGVLTDVGMEIVNSVLAARAALQRSARLTRAERRARFTGDVHVRRLALLSSILGSFVLGAALGVIAFDFVSMQWAMFLPVTFLAWIIAQDLKRPIAEITPSALVAEHDLGLPASLGVFKLNADRNHHGVQRLPDLVAWINRLRADLRVVVIDLTDVRELEEDAGLELRAALVRMKELDRMLIIAGVSGDQYQRLRSAGAGSLLTPHNVCPDLELAIARGLMALEPAPWTTRARPAT